MQLGPLQDALAREWLECEMNILNSEGKRIKTPHSGNSETRAQLRLYEISAQWTVKNCQAIISGMSQFCKPNVQTFTPS